jgi:hypothetical protein
MTVNPAVAGSARSKTMWFAAALIVLSAIQPLVPSIGLALGCSPQSLAAIGSSIGVIVAYLRTITTDSLTEKGEAAAAAAAPQSPPPIP